jgi:hypothetical protein
MPGGRRCWAYAQIGRTRTHPPLAQEPFELRSCAKAAPAKSAKGQLPLGSDIKHFDSSEICNRCMTERSSQGQRVTALLRHRRDLRDIERAGEVATYHGFANRMSGDPLNRHHPWTPRVRAWWSMKSALGCSGSQLTSGSHCSRDFFKFVRPGGSRGQTSLRQ